MKKQPEKTAQTKQSMIDAFWNIAEKRGLQNVTISEVTKKAQLNRGTFYVYFSDIDDLLYQAEQEIVADFRSKIESILAKNELSDFPNLSHKLIEILGMYDDKLFLLLGKNGDPVFLDLVRKEASSVFSSVLKISDTNPYQDYIIAYATSAITGLLQFWHETGRELSLEELSGIAHGMMTYGLLGLKEKLENNT